MLDLLVKGGLIVDGSGNPGFYGAVGILEGKVHVFRGDLVGLERLPNHRRHRKGGVPGLH